MKYRSHRGSLADAMMTMIEIEPTHAAVVAQARKELAMWPTALFLDKDVKIEPYYGDDDRIGWKDVHIITIDGYGVLGFCEGPVT